MNRRFTETQILGFLREAAAGAPVMDLCWNHCFSRSTFRAWKAKYGAAIDEESGRVRRLERENARLRRELACRVGVKREASSQRPADAVAFCAAEPAVTETEAEATLVPSFASRQASPDLTRFENASASLRRRCCCAADAAPHNASVSSGLSASARSKAMPASVGR
jgi:putative transposase